MAQCVHCVFDHSTSTREGIARPHARSVEECFFLDISGCEEGSNERHSLWLSNTTVQFVHGRMTCNRTRGAVH